MIDAHAPEAPTRFAKQLTQIVRGGVAIGMDRADALRLAIRCARDSVPPLRLAVLDDVAEHPGSSTAEVRRRLGKPRPTVDRELQALHMLGVLDCDEEETEWAGKPSTRWRYTIREGIEPDSLQISTRKVTTSPHTPKEEGERVSPVHLATDISGTDSAAPPGPTPAAPETTSPISPNSAPGERTNPSAVSTSTQDDAAGSNPTLRPTPSTDTSGTDSPAAPAPRSASPETTSPTSPNFTPGEWANPPASRDTARTGGQTPSPATDESANTPEQRQTKHPSPDRLEAPAGSSGEDRPRCSTCDKPMGRVDARHGTCTMCRRIEAANRKAAS